MEPDDPPQEEWESEYSEWAAQMDRLEQEQQEQENENE
jgi:hypothetical protein